MKRTVIGIFPSMDEAMPSVEISPKYIQGVEDAGGIPLILPVTSCEETLEALADLLDGILFSGGHDINPALYGRPKSEHCGTPCDTRDAAELSMFKKIVLQQKKPGFGICRGAQFVNVALGGCLYQDLPTELGSVVRHNCKWPEDRDMHMVSLPAGTPLRALLGRDAISINSYHHQGIKTLADRLVPMAIAEDGLVEAICMKNQFLWAVQWHPELILDDPVSKALFAAFIDACRTV